MQSKAEASGAGNKKRKAQSVEEEWKELAEETRLMKKVKRGKMSRAAMEKMVDFDDSGDDE